MITGLIKLGAMLLVLPPFFGMPFWARDEKRRLRLGLLYTTGLAVMWAIFEAVTLPMIAFAPDRFDLLVQIYGYGSCAGAVLLVLLCHKSWFAFFRNLPAKREELHPLFLLFLAVVLCQTAYIVLHMHEDMDDAFFVATAVTTNYTGTMYQIDPYTGISYISLPIRYVLSPFPVWEAFLARISGLHPAAVAHTILPAVLIPAAYMVYREMARELFPEKKKEQSIFLLLLCLVFLFSGYSVRNMAAFLFLRIWQGKAVLASVLIPYLFVCLYIGLARKELRHPFWLAGFLCAACCMVSSMGILLGTMLIGLLGVFYAVADRKPAMLGYTVLSVMPGILCAGIYLVLLLIL